MRALRTSAAVLVWWLASVAAGQGIAFTVQAIAVSEQATALELSRGLLRDGFPAYVVRSTGGQGDVYRVRVGAFANRAAAARYAAAMPDIGGARPVPALAEAIPDGVMPWAPRVLWQGTTDGVDVYVAPWPGGGVAVRVQPTDPLGQPTYHLVQGGEVRSIAAWRVLPLAVRPEPRLPPLLDVPFVDLTVAPAADGAEATPPEDAATTDEGAGGADEGAGEAGGAGDGSGAAVEEEPVSDGDSGADAAGAAAAAAAAGPAPSAEADAAGAAEEAAGGVGPEVAAADGPPEEGLWLLRDRPLWPATWPDDPPEVRAAFAAATLELVVGGAGLARAAVEAAVYRPDPEGPPVLVVVDVSDRSGRDAGDVRAVGDAAAGLFPSGPEPLEGVDPAWWPPADLGERLRLDAPPAGPMDFPMGVLEADGPFVRLVPTGATSGWRAVAGVPLWGDGRHLLVRDGADLVLLDLVPR